MTTASDFSRNSSYNPPASPSENPETITINRAVIMSALASPIAYYTSFAKAVGDVCAGVFVSQMFYWHDRGHDPDGWIYKTQKEMEDETGLTRYNQETARKRLVNLGVLEEQRRGMPAKLYFKLNLGRLFELVEGDPPPSPQDAGTPQSRMWGSSNQGCGNPTNKDAAPPPSSMGDSSNQSLYTETTSESTSKSTSNNNNEAAGPSLSSVLIEEKTSDDFQEEPELQTEAETEMPPSMDLNSLCEAHGIQFETLCAVLDLYEKVVGGWPDTGGIQAIVIWMAVYGTDLVRESVRELQTAILTRKIKTDALRYLGGIIKHKGEEVEEVATQAQNADRGGGYTIPDEYADVIIG